MLVRVQCCFKYGGDVSLFHVLSRRLIGAASSLPEGERQKYDPRFVSSLQQVQKSPSFAIKGWLLLGIFFSRIHMPWRQQSVYQELESRQRCGLRLFYSSSCFPVNVCRCITLDYRSGIDELIITGRYEPRPHEFIRYNVMVYHGICPKFVLPRYIVAMWRRLLDRRVVP